MIPEVPFDSLTARWRHSTKQLIRLFDALKLHLSSDTDRCRSLPAFHSAFVFTLSLKQEDR